MTIVKLKEITKEKIILQSNVVFSGGATDASGVTYLNGNSSLAATNAQEAIDEVVNLSGGVPTWGAITGTLSDQTDLQNSLNAKASTSSLSTVATTGNSDNLTEGTSQLLMTAMERSKLTGIEAGATADQTAGEIKTAYESNLDTNAFTDSEKTKLGGVESGATANSTDATLLDRGNHTGSQVANTISDFDTAADNRISVASIGLLNNVDLTSLATGQILEFDGTNFTPIDKPSGGAVDSVNGQTGVVSLASGNLTDVDTSTLSSGQILEFDGTNLVPIDTPSGGGGGGAIPVFEQDFSAAPATTPLQITGLFQTGKNYYVEMEGLGFDWTNASTNFSKYALRFIRSDGTFSSDHEYVTTRVDSSRPSFHDDTDSASAATTIKQVSIINLNFTNGSSSLVLDILSPFDNGATSAIYAMKNFWAGAGVVFVSKCSGVAQDTNNTFTGIELLSDITGLVINQGTIKIFEGTGHVTI